MTLLVLRPEPGAAATVAAARALGLAAVAVPLFAVRALDWAVPPGSFDALVVTSANALRHGGAGLAPLRALPLYAVGAVTAAAARAAGFADVHAGDDDAAALFARARAAGRTRLLHLVGREHRVVDLPGTSVTRVAVYAAEEIDRALPAGPAVALVHSPRAAVALARRVADRGEVALAAISARAAAAAGQGWRAVAVAAAPNDAALLAAAAGLCERGA